MPGAIMQSRVDSASPKQALNRQALLDALGAPWHAPRDCLDRPHDVLGPVKPGGIAIDRAETDRTAEREQGDGRRSERQDQPGAQQQSPAGAAKPAQAKQGSGSHFLHRSSIARGRQAPRAGRAADRGYVGVVRRSPEFNLLVEACRASFGGSDSTTLPGHFQSIDGPRFVRLAKFHRVQGLVWSALAPFRDELPTEAARALADDARAIAESNLRAAVECRDLRELFEKAAIPLLFVKGLTLAALAYRTISTKSAVDVDLLIPAEDLGRSAGLLRDADYRLRLPRTSFNAKQLEAWHRHRKESAWVQPERRIEVDLHTRLADQPRLLRTIDARSAPRLVEVARGIALPTLGPEPLFGYLAVHGASSLWFRLKWVTDFAALAHRSHPGEIESHYRRSLALGAGRSAAVALLLADALYDTLAGLEVLRAELKRDRSARTMARSALKWLTREPVDPTSRPLGTLPIHLYQLGLVPGWRFKIIELVRQARATLS